MSGTDRAALLSIALGLAIDSAGGMGIVSYLFASGLFILQAFGADRNNSAKP